MAARDSAADLIAARLREIGRQLPYLREAALAYEAFLPLLLDADLHVGPVCLTAEEAHRKMDEGRPLLHGMELEIDAKSVLALMLRLTEVLQKSAGNRAALSIRHALEEGKLDVGLLLAGVVGGKADAVRSASDGLNLDPALLRTISENALRPALRVWRAQLAPLAEGCSWNRGGCFICGSPPVFGELRGNNEEKRLRCGLCGADWQFRRLRCLYCGSEDHKMQAFLYAEGEREKFRVEVCEKCKGYIKVITTFSPTPPELLPVEDLATLRFDFIARDRGYSRRAVIT